MEKVNYEKFKKLDIGLFVVVVVIVIYTFTTVFISFKSNHKKEEKKLFEVDEVRVETSESRLFVNLTNTIYTEEPFNIYVDISKYGNIKNKAISFISSYSDVKCYLGKDLIYEYKSSNNSLNNSGGRSVHVIDLPDSDEISLRIKVIPRLGKALNFPIFEMFVGSRIDIFTQYIERDFISFSVVLILYIIFILGFILGVVALIKKHYFSELFYIAVISLVMATFFGEELWIIKYFFRNHLNGIYFAKFIAMAFTPLPMLLLTIEKAEYKFRNTYYIALIITSLNIIAQLTAYYFFKVEFKIMMYYSIAILMGDIIVIITSLVFSDSKRKKDKKRIMIGLFPLLFFLIFEVLYYVFVKNVINVEILMVGSILFVLAQTYIVIIRYIELNSRKVERNIYRKMALMDRLTQIGNRTAFTLFINEIKKEPKSLWIIAIDLNNLKKINDRYGHQKGDLILTLFVDAMKAATSHENDIHLFRTGGDEFIILVDRPSGDEPVDIIQNINEELVDLPSVLSEFESIFSYGYYYHDASAEESIDNSINIADERMYRHKNSRR